MQHYVPWTEAQGQYVLQWNSHHQTCSHIYWHNHSHHPAATQPSCSALYVEQNTDVSYTISSNPRMLKIEIYQKQNKPCNQQWMPHFCNFSLVPSFQIPKPKWSNYFKSFQGSQNQPKNKEQKKKSIGWHSKQTLTKSPPCIMKSLMTRWNVEPL